MKKKDIDNIITICYEKGLNQSGNLLAKFLEDSVETQLAMDHVKIELEEYQKYLKAGRTRPNILEKINISSTVLLKMIDSLNSMEV